MSAVALRDIEPGEEMSISYAEFCQPFFQRRHNLLHTWGFRYTCSLCTAPPLPPRDELLQSSRRRSRIGKIRDEMLGLIQGKLFTKAIAPAKEMIDLVLEP